MLPRNHPDRIQIAFDDHRLVANAGLILPTTLALRLGLPQLLRKHLDLGGAPGRANTGDKMMTLVASALGGLGVRFELAHLVSGVRRSPARGCLAPGSSMAWSGLGAWWRARGGWCEVLILRTGGGEQHRLLCGFGA